MDETSSIVVVVVDGETKPDNISSSINANLSHVSESSSCEAPNKAMGQSIAKKVGDNEPEKNDKQIDTSNDKNSSIREQKLPVNVSIVTKEQAKSRLNGLPADESDARFGRHQSEQRSGSSNQNNDTNNNTKIINGNQQSIVMNLDFDSLKSNETKRKKSQSINNGGANSNKKLRFSTIEQCKQISNKSNLETNRFKTKAETKKQISSHSTTLNMAARQTTKTKQPADLRFEPLDLESLNQIIYEISQEGVRVKSHYSFDRLTVERNERGELVKLGAVWSPTWSHQSQIWCKHLIAAYLGDEAPASRKRSGARRRRRLAPPNRRYDAFKVERILAHFDYHSTRSSPNHVAVERFYRVQWSPIFRTTITRMFLTQNWNAIQEYFACTGVGALPEADQAELRRIHDGKSNFRHRFAGNRKLDCDSTSRASIESNRIKSNHRIASVSTRRSARLSIEIDTSVCEPKIETQSRDRITAPANLEISASASTDDCKANEKSKIYHNHHDDANGGGGGSRKENEDRKSDREDRERRKDKKKRKKRKKRSREEKEERRRLRRERKLLKKAERDKRKAKRKEAERIAPETSASSDSANIIDCTQSTSNVEIENDPEKVCLKSDDDNSWGSSSSPSENRSPTSDDTSSTSRNSYSSSSSCSEPESLSPSTSCSHSFSSSLSAIASTSASNSASTSSSSSSSSCQSSTRMIGEIETKESITTQQICDNNNDVNDEKQINSNEIQSDGDIVAMNSDPKSAQQREEEEAEKKMIVERRKPNSKTKLTNRNDPGFDMFAFIERLDFSQARPNEAAIRRYPFEARGYCEIAAIHAVRRKPNNTPAADDDMDSMTSIIDLKIRWRPTWEDGCHVFCKHLLRRYAEGREQPDVPAERIRNDSGSAYYKVRRILAHQAKKPMTVNGVGLNLYSFLIEWHDTTVAGKRLATFFAGRRKHFDQFLATRPPPPCDLTEDEIDRLCVQIEHVQHRQLAQQAARRRSRLLLSDDRRDGKKRKLNPSPPSSSDKPKISTKKIITSTTTGTRRSLDRAAAAISASTAIPLESDLMIDAP